MTGGDIPQVVRRGTRLFNRGRYLDAQALATLEDYRPAAHGLDVDALLKEFGDYVEWVRSLGRPHRFADGLRIPRLRV